MPALDAKLELPREGFVRLSQFLGPGRPIPVGRSTWYAGIRTGRFPPPVRWGPRLVVWRVEDIRTLIERGWQ